MLLSGWAWGSIAGGNDGGCGDAAKQRLTYQRRATRGSVRSSGGLNEGRWQGGELRIVFLENA
jgi:hypothetical protein